MQSPEMVDDEMRAKIEFAQKRIRILSLKRGCVLGQYAWQCIAWPMEDFCEWFAQYLHGMNNAAKQKLHELHCTSVAEGYSSGKNLLHTRLLQESSAVA